VLNVLIRNYEERQRDARAVQRASVLGLPPGVKKPETEEEKERYMRVSRAVIIFVFVTQILVCLLLKFLFYKKVISYPGQDSTK